MSLLVVIPHLMLCTAREMPYDMLPNIVFCSSAQHTAAKAGCKTHDDECMGYTCIHHTAPLKISQATEGSALLRQWPTYELVETPLLAFACDVEHHIAREHRIWNVEDLSLKAPDSCAIPAHIHHNTLHCLQWQPSCDILTAMSHMESFGDGLRPE